MTLIQIVTIVLQLITLVALVITAVFIHRANQAMKETRRIQKRMDDDDGRR